MKNRLLVFMSAFCILGLQNSFADEAKPAEEKKETAKEKVGEAEIAVKDYVFTQKEEFVTRMNKEMDLMKKDLAELEAKAKKATKETKVETDKKMKEAKTGLAKLKKQIASVKTSSESDWEKIKTKFNDSMEDAKKSIDKSRKWLSEKIAP